MTLINKLLLPLNGGEEEFLLPMRRFRTRNRTTVIIGENGTRKSFLLRQVLESALNEIRRKDAINSGTPKSSSPEIFLRTPSKVIAISAIPTDRFPSKPGIAELTSVSKYDVEYYSYIGPRTSRNILSRNQSIREVISQILRNPDVLRNRHKFLSRILTQIGVEPFLVFGFDGPYNNPYRKKITLQKYLEEGIDDEMKSSSRSRYFKDELEFLQTDLGRDFANQIENQIKNSDASLPPNRVRRYRSATDYPFAVFVDIRNGAIDTQGGVSVEALYWATKIGFLRAGKLAFRMPSGEVINQEELSAGQWSLFSIMMSLTLSVVDSSLILIDEPENGFHPSWQRTFFDALTEAVSHARGCHTLVATHSPLILSSLDPNTSELITLKRRPDTNSITAALEISPYGWDANQILEDLFELKDSRSPHLTQLVDTALELIAEGIERNRQQLNRLVDQLKPYLASLPHEDVGRAIIVSIIKAAKPKK